MRKIILILAVSTVAISVFGQINVKAPAKKQAVIQYDSLTNYLAVENVKAYVGQHLYVMPKSENLRDFGYEGFFTSPENDSKTTYSKASTYSRNSKYESLVDRVFKVTNVISQKGKYYGEDTFLEIVDSKDTLYYLYPDYESSFAFLTKGYKDKLDKTYVGKNFYFTNAPDEFWHDFETGDKVKLESGALWECTEIVLDGNYLFLECILKNKKGETISNMVSRMKFNFITKEYGDALRLKYGNLFNKAMSGVIAKGMTGELVIIALWKPKTINKNSNLGEQWVYNNQYLYFKDGKLDSWSSYK